MSESERGDGPDVAGLRESTIEELDGTDEVAGSLGEVYELTDSQRMDGHRYTLAILLLWMTLGLAVVMIVLAVFVPDDMWSRVDRVIALVFIPFTTLLGTALGWYFGGGGSGGRT